MTPKSIIKLQTDLSRIYKSDIRVEFIHGYLSAVLCPPELIMPSQWLHGITEYPGNALPESVDDVNVVIGQIMSLYNEIAGSLMDATYCPLYSIEKVGFVTPELTEIWAKGFCTGLSLWSTDFVKDENAYILILPIMLLAKDSFVIETIKKFGIKKVLGVDTIEIAQNDAIEKVQDNVPFLRRYYMSNSKTEPNDAFLPVKNKIRVGRNDPCPCGSGKKYKKCCGA